ncbi:serine hydrolase FSH [Leucosporidium creatinivorum]|uniref:Serine hydrolase FSH n=1 Tax=Leucosporidium creatinivorum TaxID=106004 RepID=A0A1Y2ERQ7_9BASI|nr:serine hydrolase FSH [Leucosporidium creatinivorum]
MSATPTTPRVLCLPGFAMNAKAFHGRLSQAQRIIKGAVELVFVEPPNVMLPPDFDGTTAGEAHIITEDTPRSWWDWQGNHVGFKSNAELDPLLRYLREILETQGPFDGIWGFSQGAATAPILCALVSQPSLSPIFAAPSSSPSVVWPPKQFKFAILCSGFLPLDRKLEAWFAEPLDVPTLHVLGREDVVAIAERSLANVPRFKDSRLEWHSGGHHIPRSAHWSLFFKEYMLHHLGDDLPSGAKLVSSPVQMLGKL